MAVTASDVVDQTDLGDHVCWTHDDEADGLDTLGRFATGRPPATGPAVLDLSELSFADVGAATALVRATPTGLHLVGCRPAVRRLLDLLRDGGPVERLA